MRQFHSSCAVLSRHSMPNVVKAMNSGSPLLTSLRCAWPKFLPELRNIHVHLKVEFLPCARVDCTSTDGLDADVSARLACHVISAKRVFTQWIDFTCANRTNRECCVTSRASNVPPETVILLECVWTPVRVAAGADRGARLGVFTDGEKSVLGAI